MEEQEKEKEKTEDGIAIMSTGWKEEKCAPTGSSQGIA